MHNKPEQHRGHLSICVLVPVCVCIKQGDSQLLEINCFHFTGGPPALLPIIRPVGGCAYTGYSGTADALAVAERGFAGHAVPRPRAVPQVLPFAHEDAIDSTTNDGSTVVPVVRGTAMMP